MANVPVSNMTATWTDSGTTYNAVKMNVTDTASNAASNLMDLQVGGTSQFAVSKVGKLTGKTSANLFSVNAVDINGSLYGNGIVGIGNNFLLNGANSAIGLAIGNNFPFSWSSNVNVTNYSDLNIVDLKLFRDAANTLAQRNATNAQTFRMYNTYTDASNYERLSVGWNGSIASITTAGAGTGTNRALNLRGSELYLSGSTAGDQWYFQSTGHLLAIANNTYDIGNASARPRSLYLGTSLVLATTSFVANGPSPYIANTVGNVTQFNSVGGLTTAGNGAIGFTANATSALTGADTLIVRDAADTLALRNATNPQTFRVYNTYTDASNYERGFLKWATNILAIGTEKGSGGGTARDLAFQTDGTTRLTIGTTGIVTTTSDVRAAGSLEAGTSNSIYFNNRTVLSSSADGLLRLGNQAGTDFSRLQFGGTTSSFPALKRSATTLQVRLADDSAFAPLEASTLTTSNAYTVATLPAAGVAGRRAYVTDATAPTFLGALTGGGAVKCPVFDNGTAWVAG